MEKQVRLMVSNVRRNKGIHYPRDVALEHAHLRRRSTSPARPVTLRLVLRRVECAMQ